MQNILLHDSFYVRYMYFYIKMIIIIISYCLSTDRSEQIIQPRIHRRNKNVAFRIMTHSLIALNILIVLKSVLKKFYL